MKINFKVQHLLLLLWGITACFLSAAAIRQQDPGYIVEHENDNKKDEPGSHNGGGVTTVYPFFAKDKGVKVAFRKRVLHPGSSIGYHLGDKYEIYYVLSGKGTLRVNDKDIAIAPGDALLLKPGSSHGIKPNADNDLSLMITYTLEQPAK